MPQGYIGNKHKTGKAIEAKVRKEGASGVRHGNRGKPSPKAFPEAVRERVIGLADKKYFDFNFSHLSEMLDEREGIKVNWETLRRWLRRLNRDIYHQKIVAEDQKHIKSR